MKHILNDMEVVDCFNVCLNVPALTKVEEVSAVMNNFNGNAQEISRMAKDFIDVHN